MAYNLPGWCSNNPLLHYTMTAITQPTMIPSGTHFGQYFTDTAQIVLNY